MSPTIARSGTEAEPWRYCREGSQPVTVDAPAAEAEEREDISAEEAILCRACRAPLTSSREAIAVNGTHIHTFFNPAGIVYEISCFRRASGCTVYGEPSAEFAWFAGSNWQYAVCATCQVHLGWFFTMPAETFFGLIRDRLLASQG